jgi:hypothetical protein
MPIVWNKVTWYSKLLALILLVGVFYLGYYLGQLSVKVIDPEKASGKTDYSVPASQNVQFNLGPTQLDAVRGASEACDQNVFLIHCGNKQAKQQRNAPTV